MSSLLSCSTTGCICSFLRVPARKNTSCHCDELVGLAGERGNVLDLRNAAFAMAGDAEFGLFLAVRGVDNRSREGR